MEILKRNYWSRADAFLMPLTGLKKSSVVKINSYLFWERYSIEDYNLILVIGDEDAYQRIEYCKTIFPILDKKGYLVESHDEPGRTILVLDMSEWALDIEMFLKGRYSVFSKEAKGLIEAYHKFSRNQIPVHIYCILYPNIKLKDLGDVTAIEYVSKYYDIPLDRLQEIGEIGSIYDNVAESLKSLE